MDLQFMDTEMGLKWGFQDFATAPKATTQAAELVLYNGEPIFK